MSLLLAVSGVSKRYGGRAVLADTSLTIARGEMVAVLGPSGSGKTTLFRCLTRLVEPDAGRIDVAGEDITAMTGRQLAAARRKIGVVFQQFNLVGRLSALDNVLAGRLADAALWRVMLRRFADDDVDRAIAALDAVGLGDHLHQRADTLSGGQQQRVAIARALAQESLVLLADEPVASLDPETAMQILGVLRSLAHDRGLAVLCTLHQPDLARHYADRVLTMAGGRLVGSQAVETT